MSLPKPIDISSAAQRWADDERDEIRASHFEDLRPPFTEMRAWWRMPKRLGGLPWIGPARFDALIRSTSDHSVLAELQHLSAKPVSSLLDVEVVGVGAVGVLLDQDGRSLPGWLCRPDSPLLAPVLDTLVVPAWVAVEGLAQGEACVLRDRLEWLDRRAA